MAKTCAPRGSSMLQSTPSSTPQSDKVLLPLGAMMLAASVGSWAQTGTTPEPTLPAATVKEQAAPQVKDPLLIKQTTGGKGQQEHTALR